MKRFAPMNWKPLLILAFLALPTAPLAGQTELQLREVRERAAESRRRAEERLVRVQESRELAAHRALQIAEEHAQQVRVRSGREAERALARSLDRVRERTQDIQQVVVRLRARVRLGVSLDGNQGEEYDSQGVLVKDVLDDSPAEAAGLQEGDIITHLNGQSLLNAIPDEDDEEFDEDGSLPVQRLMALAGELEDGEEVEVRYLRDGAAASVTLEAAKMNDNWVSVMPRDFEGGIYRFGPEDRRNLRLRFSDEGDIRLHLDELTEKFKNLEIDFPKIEFEEGRNFRVYRGDNDFAFGFIPGAHSHGLELRDLNPDLGAYFSTDEGVLVMEVDEESSLGLRPGDVILSIGDRGVEDTRDVFRILGSYEDEEAITFTVMRHGQETRVDGITG